MQKKVLIIEDDIQLNFVITEYFKMKNHETLSIHDGIEAIDEIDKIINSDIKLYVIDINLPSLNGLDILKYIREKDSQAPIIIITASLEIENFTKAFQYGCDEYIKKPFHIKELDIRVNNILKKNNSITELRKNFYYDYNTKSFFYQQTEITLRNKERRLIEILLQNINKIVPSQLIHEYVWENEDKEYYPLRQLLTDVRKKLPFDLIRTKVRQGYMIEI